MRSLLKFFGVIIIIGIIASIILGLLLALPPVQKKLLVWSLSDPDREVTIESVRIRPFSAVLGRTALTTPDQKIEFTGLQSTFRLRPLLFKRTLDIKSVAIENLTIDLQDPAEPKDRRFWESYPGILWQPPFDFRLGQARINGFLQSPAVGKISFTVNAENIDSRADQGSVSTALRLDSRHLPGNGTLSADLYLKPVFDPTGIFQQLRADLTARESGDQEDLAAVELIASRTDQGEDYQLLLAAAPPARQPREATEILRLEGEWLRATGQATGNFDLQLERALVPTGLLPAESPDFSVRSKGDFSFSGTDEFKFSGEQKIQLSSLSDHFGLPAELDAVNIAAMVQLAFSRNQLEIGAFKAGITALPDTDLARIEMPREFTVDLSGQDWFQLETETPMLLIDFPGIPAELINPFLSDLKITARPIRAQTAVYGHHNQLRVRTTVPWTISELTILNPDGPLVENAEIIITPSGTLSAAGFDLDLNAALTIPRLTALDLQARGTGTLPLSRTDVDVNIRTEMIPDSIPYSEWQTGIRLTADHHEAVMPENWQVEARLHGSPRPAAPRYLPRNIDLRGELGRHPDTGFHDYNLQLHLHPDNEESGARPAVDLHGRLTDGWSRGSGTVAITPPEWMLEALLEDKAGIQELRATATLDYNGSFSPLDLNVISTADLELDTGLHHWPGQGSFTAAGRAVVQLGATAELESWQAVLAVADSKAELVSANLLQRLKWDRNRPLLEQLPEGDFIDLEVGKFDLVDWLPETHRQAMTGGAVSGGLRLHGANNNLYLRPGPRALRIENLQPGRLYGEPLAPLDITLQPFVRITPEKAAIRVNELTVSTRNRLLATADAAAEIPFPAPPEADLPRLFGSLSVRGDIAAVNQLTAEPILPHLVHSNLSLETDFAVYPDPDLRITWDSRLTVADLQSDSAVNPFNVKLDFNGQVNQDRGQGRIVSVVDHENVRQRAIADLRLENPPRESLMALAVEAESEFISLPRIQSLAAAFSFRPDPVPTIEPITGLLPVNLTAELAVDRMQILPDLVLTNVYLQLTGNDQEINLQQARAGIFDQARLQGTASLRMNEGGVALLSTGSGENINIVRLLKELQNVEDPDIEGIFAFAYRMNSRALYWHELYDHLNGAVNLAGANGRMRFTVPDRRMARIRGLLGMQEGAIAAAIARLAGAPPGVQALTESINLLTNLPYSSLTARINLQPGELTLENLELIGPYLYAAGRGGLAELDLTELAQSGLNLEIELAAKDRLRQQFHILNLMSDQQNERGYQYMRHRPITIGGTLGEPDLTPLWDLLIQAGIGAARPGTPEEPGEQPRIDPRQELLEGLRGIIGF